MSSEPARTDPPDAPLLDANISMLFRETSFLDRPAAAAKAGFDAIECWWPFDGPVPDVDERDRFVRAVRQAEVSLVAMNLDAGDLAAGERGLLSDPSQRERFRRGLEAGIALADELDCRVLHAMYGNRRLGLDPREQDELAVEHLAIAAEAANEIGAIVVVEALNPWENPLYPWHRTEEVVAFADRVALESGRRIWCLYDVYHAQRSEGELIATISRHVTRFGHVQLADVPGRAEPGTGEIAVPRVLAALAEHDYRGYVGLEYEPSTTTDASLADLPSWRAALTGKGGGP